MNGLARYPRGTALEYDLGLCAVAIARDAEGRVLAGRPNVAHPRWREWSGAPLPESSGVRWRLPAAYVAEGEHPDHAAERVLNGQLLVENFRLLAARAWSLGGSRRPDRSREPWDLCFVFEVEIVPRKALAPWWSELRFLDFEAASHSELAPPHGDLAYALGLLKEKPPPPPPSPH
ncbi:MAG TPA: hypothetical protein VM681_06915 [Candidatus Thermoplasmatota archaeon]|nr:hypothetical protein [Candidatus Thermoplasmatota archaeon]